MDPLLLIYAIVYELGQMTEKQHSPSCIVYASKYYEKIC